MTFGTAGFGGNQVRIVHSRDEAAAALEHMRRISPGQPFAQGYVRGGRYLFGGVFHHGATLRSYAHRTGFLLSRGRPGVWATLRSLPPNDFWKCVKAVPWRRPGLAFHVMRRAYRFLSG